MLYVLRVLWYFELGLVRSSMLAASDIKHTTDRWSKPTQQTDPHAEIHSTAWCLHHTKGSSTQLGIKAGVVRVPLLHLEGKGVCVCLCGRKVEESSFVSFASQTVNDSLFPSFASWLAKDCSFSFFLASVMTVLHQVPHQQTSGQQMLQR